MDIWKKAEEDIVIRGDKMNIIESCLDRHAKSSPNRSAFIFEDDAGNIKSYPYKELQREANKFANLLEKMKVKQDSRVFIFLPKIPEMYISFLGIIKQGSIAAPLFEAFQTDGLELRLERGGANVLVTNNELLARLKNKIKNMKIIVIDSDEYKEQIEECSDEFETVLKNKKDTATMIFTSSTAGTPVAGVNICHYALVQQHYTGKLVLGLKPEDRYWCTAHPGWVTGSIYGIIAPLSIGCTSYVYEGHFSAARWINFLIRNRISVLYTAPTALRMLKPEIKKEHLKYLKNLCSVGEALTKAVFDFYKQLGIEINDTYWQTETGAMVICSWPGLIKKYGSIGKAIPGISAEIINGTIHLQPDFPAIMTSIYNHEQMYKEYFVDGWFKTNDMAEKDKEGYFFFVGRKDDIIKTAGERVSPIEVESVLMKHKAVKETAVIGVPDEIKGSVIKAFIVLNSGFKESEELKQKLSMFAKQNYAGHSYPKQIEFVPSLPKTNSGKIIRAALRKN